MHIAIGGVCGLSFLLAVYLTFFNPPTVARRRLRRQAREDYRNARGTTHLRMLRDAQRWAVTKHQRMQTALQAAEARLPGMQEEEAQELLRALQTHLVHSRFGEVEGLGPALRERVIQAIFRGRLTDLHGARRVRGVGDQRQMAISAWVQRYEPQLHRLVQQDFPGKSDVRSRCAAQREQVQAEVTTYRQQLAEIDSTLRQVQDAIDRLQAITERDFVEAVLYPDRDADHLDAYLIGAFPTWRPVPEWFRKAVGGDGEAA